ncbi:MAG: hypothetical protein R3Y23_04870 [Bacillota bacterium]
MVKERRDITIDTKDSSRMGYGGTYVQTTKMTAYDEFREKKAQSSRSMQTVNCAGTCAHITASNEDMRGGYKSSTSYIKEDNFSYENSAKTATSASVAVSRRKITKSGKIFVALYVLIVAVIAFIILSASSMTKPVSAEADTDMGQEVASIASMELDSESVEATNWFDELLDDLGE